MGKSRKREPWVGNANHSDKPFKKTEHRRFRRIVNSLIKAYNWAMPHIKAFGNPWHSCKDGKHRLDEENRDKWMRK